MSAYRNELEALAARHAALDADLARATRERDEAARNLAEARARARLPILDNIRIATPCSMRWDEMVGDERIRHCGSCDQDVFNLSAMTRDEAQALIVEKAGKLCARYYQRVDGTILLADCEVGVRGRRRRRWMAAGAAALLAGGGAAWLARGAAGKRHEEQVVMGAVGPSAGAIAPEPPPAPEPRRSQPPPHDDPRVVTKLGGVGPGDAMHTLGKLEARAPQPSPGKAKRGPHRR